MRRYVLGFLGANGLCVVLASLAGGIAHLAAASVDQDLYSLAVGDRLLPGSPIESWLWGPLLIGTFVTWWFGLIVAPFYYAASLFGPRRSVVRPILWFVTLALTAFALLVGWRTAHESGTTWREQVLLSLLGPGYAVLGIAFAALCLSRWRGRTPVTAEPSVGAYPRPAS